MSYELAFSPVFKITLKRLCSFLTRKYSQKLSHETKLFLQKNITEILPHNSCSGPICDRLLDLGVAGYRQLIIDKNNIVIYKLAKLS